MEEEVEVVLTRTQISTTLAALDAKWQMADLSRKSLPFDSEEYEAVLSMQHEIEEIVERLRDSR